MRADEEEKVEPKPFDILAEDPPYYKKTIKFKNDTSHSISIGQLPSDWDSVNFVIEDYESKSRHRLVRWLATLEPTDTIQLTFNEPDMIEP